MIGRRRLLVLPVAGLARPEPRFAIGVSSSAYQIEGALSAGGRGPGIWDAEFAANPRGPTEASASAACDHYHRFPADFALLAAAGIQDYRFSLSWCRLFPSGSGARNEAGFAFYDRLIDCLLTHGIKPWVCLYHWDLPLALQAEGGWENRATAYHFADFASAVMRCYADRLHAVIMLNEAAVQAFCGYGYGWHPPHRSGARALFAAVHHLNLAQALGISVARATAPGLPVGTVISAEPIYPATGTEADQHAADRFRSLWSHASLDPAYLGAYPASIASNVAFCERAEDASILREVPDFIGLTYYEPIYVTAASRSPIGANFAPKPREVAQRLAASDDGLQDALAWVSARYGHPPLVVAETGIPAHTGSLASDELDDWYRIRYLEQQLATASQAARGGIQLAAFFVWSFLDSVEWDTGKTIRFGLVYVDFATQQRQPKKSFAWLAERAARLRH